MRDPKSLSPAEIVLWYEYEIKEDIPPAVDYYLEYCQEKAKIPYGVVAISAGIDNLNELVNVPFSDFIALVEKVSEVNSHFLEIFADRLKRAAEEEAKKKEKSEKKSINS